MESNKRTFHIGCCGWAYLRPAEFSGRLPDSPGSRLQAYARLFSAVEVNSTFYRLPRPATAEKWAAEAKTVNPAFEFTLKAYRGITHVERFQGNSRDHYARLREIARRMRSKILLFQIPPALSPTPENLRCLDDFFHHLDREDIQIAFEPRGRWYASPAGIRDFCEKHNLIHCVDPLRNEPLFFGREKVGYFRLHGFGKRTMYAYTFSETELLTLKKKMIPLTGVLNRIYVFFNNTASYANALTFCEMMAPDLPG